MPSLVLESHQSAETLTPISVEWLDSSLQAVTGFQLVQAATDEHPLKAWTQRQDLAKNGDDRIVYAKVAYSLPTRSRLLQSTLPSESLCPDLSLPDLTPMTIREYSTQVATQSVPDPLLTSECIAQDPTLTSQQLTVTVELASELPSEVLQLRGGSQIVLTSRKDESMVGWAGVYEVGVMVEVRDGKETVQKLTTKFQVTVERYAPDCSFDETQLPTGELVSLGFRTYFIEDSAPEARYLNFTTMAVFCAPSQFAYQVDNLGIKAFSISETEFRERTNELIEQTGDTTYRFSATDSALIGTNIAIVQVAEVVPLDPRSTVAPFSIKQERGSLQVKSLCSADPPAQLDSITPLTKMTITSSLPGKTVSQPLPTITLAQEVDSPCGVVAFGLETDLPGTVIGIVGDQINLQSEPASGYEGSYQSIVTVLVDNRQVDQVPFTVLINEPTALSFITETRFQNKPPVFQGIDNQQLPGVTAMAGQELVYTFPVTYDPDGDKVKLFVYSTSGSQATYRLTSAEPQQLVLFFTKADIGSQVAFEVRLRDTFDESLYYLAVTVVEEARETPTPEPVEVPQSTFFVPLLTDDDDSLTESKPYQFSFFADDNCLPRRTFASRDGLITVSFNRDLFIEPVYRDSLSDYIKAQGIIQVQLISSTSSRGSSQDDKSFDWAVKVTENKRKLEFQLEFKEAGAISSTSNTNDRVRILFTERTQEVIRCETVADLFQGTEEADEKQPQPDPPVLDGDNPNIIPPDFSLTVELPAQHTDSRDSSMVDVQEVIESVEDGTKAILFSSILLAAVLNLSLQLLWGGIHALQIIAHLPLNNVNFPSEAFVFFQFLAEVVSFDLFAPTDYFDFNFTETQPFNSNYEELGYETTNFIENIGSIGLICVVIALRHIVQPPLFWLLTRAGCCKCWRDVQDKMAFTLPQVSSTWCRFGLETYFEFIISCLIGLRIVGILPEEHRTRADNASIVVCYLFTVMTFMFPVFVAFITLYLVRPYVKSRKIIREAANAEALRKVAEDEKHRDNVTYGPHAFFRHESEILNSQRGALTGQNNSLELQSGPQFSQKSPEPALKGTKTLLQLPKIGGSARSLLNSASKPSLKMLQTSPSLGGSPPVRTENGSPTNGSPKVTPFGLLTKQKTTHEGFQQHPRLLGKQQAVSMRQPRAPQITKQGTLNSPKGIVEESPSLSPPLRPYKQPLHSLLRLKSQVSCHSAAQGSLFGGESNTQSVGVLSIATRRTNVVARPASLKVDQGKKASYGWIEYVQALFSDLKMHQMSAQPFYLIHVLRRVVFVIVAMNFQSRPWLQILLYVVQSVVMLAFIRNERPFDCPRTNTLESINEAIVLVSGYHMVLITGFEIPYRIRNKIGTSLICWLVSLILLNFVLWLYDLVHNIRLQARRLKYRRAMRKALRERRQKAKKLQKSQSAPVLKSLTTLGGASGDQAKPTNNLPSIAEGDSFFSRSSGRSSYDAADSAGDAEASRKGDSLMIESERSKSDQIRVPQPSQSEGQNSSYQRLRGLIGADGDSLGKPIGDSQEEQGHKRPDSFYASKEEQFKSPATARASARASVAPTPLEFSLLSNHDVLYELPDNLVIPTHLITHQRKLSYGTTEDGDLDCDLMSPTATNCQADREPVPMEGSPKLMSKKVVQPCSGNASFTEGEDRDEECVQQVPQTLGQAVKMFGEQLNEQEALSLTETVRQSPSKQAQEARQAIELIQQPSREEPPNGLIMLQSTELESLRR